ncbi:MAG: hypothetical protein KGJ53_09315 [Alphaproteobacteria bacterium]|nr:hypothetical protein [Alphaproteobacteria bacterium]
MIPAALDEQPLLECEYFAQKFDRARLAESRSSQTARLGRANMKTALWIAAAVTLAFASLPAFAYTLKNETAKGCDGDGSACIVVCDNGSRAGAMNWNGNYWTDGERWNKDRDTEAQEIVDSNGSSCT